MNNIEQVEHNVQENTTSEDIMSTSSPNVKTSEDFKCSECDFIAKNKRSLSNHITKRHKSSKTSSDVLNIKSTSRHHVKSSTSTSKVNSYKDKIGHYIVIGILITGIVVITYFVFGFKFKFKKGDESK